jgi:hypothetical protein
MRTLNDKTIWLDQNELAVLRTDANVLRETVIERAVASGRIPATSRDRYRERYQRDQRGTVHLLAGLAPGVTPARTQRLADFERRQDDDLLAAARAAFPELRGRRASGGESPVRPVSPAHAGWYRRTNGAPVVKDAGTSRAIAWQNYSPDLPNGLAPQREGLEARPAPFPDGLNIGR